MDYRFVFRLGLTDQQATFDRFDYRQKFEYWGLLMGSAIIGIEVGFERSLAVIGDDILYVGDHVYADVHVSSQIRRWRTALILRELEDEIRSRDEVKAAYDAARVMTYATNLQGRLMIFFGTADDALFDAFFLPPNKRALPCVNSRRRLSKRRWSDPAPAPRTRCSSSTPSTSPPG